MDDTDASARDGSSHQAQAIRLLPRVGRTLSALAFWCAIGLPAVYLPLLAAGVETTDGLSTFLLLFGLHVVALVGGRGHRPTGAFDSRRRSIGAATLRERPSRRRSPR